LHSTIVFLTQAVPEGRVFALDTQTLIGTGIQLLNGIILAVALNFILYKPVKRFMQNRTEKIQNKIDDSDATMTKANRLIEEYESKKENIDKERLQVLEAARLEAVDEKQVILEEARKEAARLKKRSLDSIEADKKRFKIDTRLYIIELSTLMAEKYITHNIGNEDQDKLFDDALAQLEDKKWRK